MKLLDYYYSIRNHTTTGGNTQFDVTLLSECSVYDGHFPGMPVAPGVCNIQMIKECVEQMTGQSLLLESIAQCKFLAMITPQQHDDLQINIDLLNDDDKKYNIKASICRDGKEFITLKCVMVYTP
ncbi:MAG: beta-hydroxyacyl-ACP dehydratase [Tannerella sp.]|jgi:3-hydroxyacyl-[acyl-carrier-protein] dehydratase|nr:beta-hydroxyacyl-ACP dehydratase [Tannerella sp.]